MPVATTQPLRILTSQPTQTTIQPIQTTMQLTQTTNIVILSQNTTTVV